MVAQTRPKGGCQTAMPRRKRRRRNVWTADSTSAMDISQESVAPRTEDSEKIHKMPECITKGEPKSEAAPPASHGMAQPNCSDYSRTDPLPLGSGRLGPAGHDSPAGKPPAEMNICNTPDTIQREMSMMLVKMADGLQPGTIRIHQPFRGQFTFRISCRQSVHVMYHWSAHHFMCFVPLCPTGVPGRRFERPCTDSMSTIQNSLIFRRANPWRRVVSTEQDMHGSTVKGEFTVSEPCDLLCRRRSLPPNRAGTEGDASVYAHVTLVHRTNFPPNENAGGRNNDYIWLPSKSDHSCRRRSLPPNTAVTKVGGLVHEHLTLFRRTKFPPNRFVVSLYRYRKFVRRPDPTPEVCAAGRNSDYIRSNIGTVPSVCDEPVTGHKLTDRPIDLDDAIFCGQPSLLLE